MLGMRYVLLVVLLLSIESNQQSVPDTIQETENKVIDELKKIAEIVYGAYSEYENIEILNDTEVKLLILATHNAYKLMTSIYTLTNNNVTISMELKIQIDNLRLKQDKIRNHFIAILQPSLQTLFDEAEVDLFGVTKWIFAYYSGEYISLKYLCSEDFTESSSDDSESTKRKMLKYFDSYQNAYNEDKYISRVFTNLRRMTLISLRNWVVDFAHCQIYLNNGTSSQDTAKEAIFFKNEIKQKLKVVAVEFEERLTKEVNLLQSQLNCYENGTEKITPIPVEDLGMSIFGFVQGIRNAVEVKPNIIPALTDAISTLSNKMDYVMNKVIVSLSSTVWQAVHFDEIISPLEFLKINYIEMLKTMDGSHYEDFSRLCYSEDHTPQKIMLDLTQLFQSRKLDNSITNAFNNDSAMLDLYKATSCTIKEWTIMYAACEQVKHNPTLEQIASRAYGHRSNIMNMLNETNTNRMVSSIV